MSGTRPGGKRPSRPHAAPAAVVVLVGSGMLIACGDGGEEGAPTVIVPLAAPGVFTAAILTFFFAWNDCVFGISLTATNNARPVPAALAFFTGESFFQRPAAAIAAASVIVTVPVVAPVLVFQRRITGLTAGAVKG